MTYAEYDSGLPLMLPAEAGLGGSASALSHSNESSMRMGFVSSSFRVMVMSSGGSEIQHWWQAQV